MLEVEAYVVDIEGAACADDAGLLNPLLHCFQRNIFNVNVWALPAIEVQACPSLMALSTFQQGSAENAMTSRLGRA